MVLLLLLLFFRGNWTSMRAPIRESCCIRYDDPFEFETTLVEDEDVVNGILLLLLFHPPRLEFKLSLSFSLFGDKIPLPANAVSNMFCISR